MTVREFLSITGAKIWHECHWSLAQTDEQARAWFENRGLTGFLYRVPFGWWLAQKGENE